MEPERYNFKTIEKKWQTYWEQNKSFEAKVLKDKNKSFLNF